MAGEIRLFDDTASNAGSIRLFNDASPAPPNPVQVVDSGSNQQVSVGQPQQTPDISVAPASDQGTSFNPQQTGGGIQDQSSNVQNQPTQPAVQQPTQTYQPPAQDPLTSLFNQLDSLQGNGGGNPELSVSQPTNQDFSTFGGSFQPTQNPQDAAALPAGQGQPFSKDNAEQVNLDALKQYQTPDNQSGTFQDFAYNILSHVTTPSQAVAVLQNMGDSDPAAKVEATVKGLLQDFKGYAQGIASSSLNLGATIENGHGTNPITGQPIQSFQQIRSDNIAAGSSPAAATAWATIGIGMDTLNVVLTSLGVKGVGKNLLSILKPERSVTVGDPTGPRPTGPTTPVTLNSTTIDHFKTDTLTPEEGAAIRHVTENGNLADTFNAARNGQVTVNVPNDTLQSVRSIYQAGSETAAPDQTVSPTFARDRTSALRMYNQIGISVAGDIQPINAGLRAIESQFATPAGKQAAQDELQAQVTAGKVTPNPDGTITVYRGGNPVSQNQLVSVSVDPQAAAEFGPVQSYTIPQEAVAAAKGLDTGELLVDKGSLLGNQPGFFKPGVPIEALQTYLSETSKGVGASTNLEDQIYTLQKNAEADKLQAVQLLKGVNLSPGDSEALYHHLENPKEPLTPSQQKVFDTVIKPLSDQNAKLVAKVKPNIPLNEESYVPRFVQGKGNLLDRITDPVKNAKASVGNVLNKTAPSTKQRTMKALVDEQGNRTVASVKGGRVTAFQNKAATDLGPIKIKSLQDLMDKEISPIQQKISRVSAELKTLQSVKTRSPITDTRLNNLEQELAVLHANLDHASGVYETPPTRTVTTAKPQISDAKLRALQEQYRVMVADLDNMSSKPTTTGEVNRAGKKVTQEQSILNRLKPAKTVTTSTKPSESETLQQRISIVQKKIAQEEAVLKRVLPADKVTLTNQRIKTLEGKVADLHGKIDSIQANYDPNQLNGKRFVAKDGKTYQIKDATTKEIEASTNIKYHKDALTNLVVTNLKLNQVSRAVDFMEAYKNSPEFSNIAVKLEDNPPANFRPTALRQFTGYAFEPHVANVLDQFNNQMQGTGDPLAILTAANRFLRTAIFFNPLVHVPNITVHWAVQRGVTGFVTPRGIRDLGSTGARAINAVMHQNQDYLDMLRAGAPLMSTSKEAAGFYKLMLDKSLAELKTSNDPVLVKNAKLIAKNLNPYTLSNTVTWAVNDVATMQAIYEEMGHGKTMQEAIAEVGKHIPNYRVPTNVLGSANLGKVLTNPNITMFGGYHYGMVRSYFEMAHTLVTGDQPAGERMGSAATGARAKTLDRLLMLGLITYVLYPQLDKLARSATGNPNASFRRAGASTVLDLAGKVKSGTMDVATAIQGLVTPAAGTKELVQQAANRDFFTGANIRLPGGGAKDQAKQTGTHALQAFAPAAAALKIQNGQTWKDFGLSLIGVKNPKSSPSISVAYSLIYDQKGKVSSQVDQFLLDGKKAEAQAAVDAFNQKLIQAMQQAETDSSVPVESPSKLQKKFPLDFLKLPTKQQQQNYRSQKNSLSAKLGIPVQAKQPTQNTSPLAGIGL